MIYNRVIKRNKAQLGQIVQKIILNQQIEIIDNRQPELEGEYEEVQQKEQEIVQKLNEKYGPGQLDPQSGVFTCHHLKKAPQG